MMLLMTEKDRINAIIAAVRRAQANGVSLSSMARGIGISQAAFSVMLSKNTVWEGRIDDLESHLEGIGYAPEYFDPSSPEGKAKSMELELISLITQSYQTVNDHTLSTESRVTILGGQLERAIRVQQQLIRGYKENGND